MTPASSEHQVIAALLQSGLLTPESLERVQTAARQSGVSVSSVVTRLGLVTEQEMAWKVEGTRSYQELTRRSLATMTATQPLSAVEPGRKRVQVTEILPLSVLKAGTKP